MSTPLQRILENKARLQTVEATQRALDKDARNQNLLAELAGVQNAPLMQARADFVGPPTPTNMLAEQQSRVLSDIAANDFGLFTQIQEQRQAQQAALAEQMKAQAERDLIRLEAVKNSQNPIMNAKLTLDPQDRARIEQEVGPLDNLSNEEFLQAIEPTEIALRAAAQQPAPQAPDAIRTLQALANNPELAAVDRQRRAAGATTVNVSSGQKAEDKKLGEGRAARFNQAQDDANLASAQIGQVDLMLSQLETLETGNFEDNKISFQETLAGFGVDVGDLSKVSDRQAYNSQVRGLLLDLLKQQKGPQTEGDANRALSTLPAFRNQREANVFIAKSLRAINQRKVQYADFLDNFRLSFGTLDGADKAWREYTNSTPIFVKVKGPGGGDEYHFFNDYVESFLELNPGASRFDAESQWRERSGR